MPWLKATRAPFLTATIVPVLLGAAIAWSETSRFNWGFFWLTLLGVVFIHTGTNLVNDYFDHKSGNDEANLNYNPFSGGSRVIQDKEIPARGILYFAVSFFAAGSIIGLYLNYALENNVVLALGIIGILLGFFYTAAPLKIGYRGMGELVVGFCFGPLVVFGAYYVQAKHLSILPVISAIPVGILVLLILYINEFPDYAADKQVRKNTVVVLLGKDQAIYLYQGLLYIVYLFIIAAVFSKALPVFCLLTLATMSLAIKAVKNLKLNFNNIPGLLFSNAATIKLHLFIGLILSFGFVLGKII